MQRTLKGIVATIMAAVLALAGVTSAQAQEYAGDTYLAYTRDLESANGTTVHAISALPGDDYVAAEVPNPQEQIVYCFNKKKGLPYQESWVPAKKTDRSEEWPRWTRAYGDLHQYASDPRGSEIDAQVLKVIYNGYDGGNDRAGIQKKYNLSDAEFREATQQAVWYYTDSFRFDSKYGQDTVDAAKALAGLDESTQLKNPPSNSTLEIFKSNQIGASLQSDTGFQNLLGVKFVDEETGEPIDDDCGCEYPKVDIVRNDDGSVTIITQSGPGDENIKRETISASKVTLTDVTNEEGRRGVQIEVVNPDGSKDSKVVWGGLDGKDGQDGAPGKDGQDGKDGLSVTAVTERGEQDGKTGSWIRTYIVEADGTRGELISETFVKDGKDGEGLDLPGSDLGSTDNDTLNRCLANAAESPLVWLIPIGVLAGVGGPLLQPYMGVFQEQIDKINADLAGQFQFNRDRDPFGIGGRGSDNQNSQWGEFQARINDANRQFQEALGSPQVQQAGQVAAALVGVIAAGSAIYKWCTTEPTASVDATETAKLSS